MNEYEISSDLDKSLLIMFYLEQFRDFKGITTKELSEGFKEAREKVPDNLADKFQKLAKKGYIQPIKKLDKLNYWTFTNSGEAHIKSIKK